MRTLLASLILLCTLARAQAVQFKAEDEKFISRGSAFFITEHKILTCYHTIEEQERSASFFVKLGDTWQACKLLATDKDNDIALLETRATGKPVEFAEMPELTISGARGMDPVSEWQASFTDAIIFVRPLNKKDPMDATAECGASGGPVMAGGRLIGMLKAQFTIKEKSIISRPGVYAVLVSADVLQKFVKGK